MKRSNRKNILSVLVTIILLVLMWQLHARDYSLFNDVRNLVFDGYQSLKPRENEDTAVVIIDVDETSLRELGQWPWQRSQMATIVNNATKAGAFAIGFDMVFAEKDRTNPSSILSGTAIENNKILFDAVQALPDHDEQFAEAIGNSNVVLGFVDGEGVKVNEVTKIAGISWLGKDLTDSLQKLDGAISSLPNLQAQANGSATFNVGINQTDDIIRTIPLFVNYDGQAFPTLSIETLRAAIQSASGELQSFLIKTSHASGEYSGGLDNITDVKLANFEFPTTSDGQFQIYYSKFDQTRLISASRVFLEKPEQLASELEGRIVLIGTSATALQDIRTTALRERVPGVAIHAQILDQIMQGSFLSRPDWAPGLERLAMVITSILIIAVLPFWGPISSALFGGLLALGILAASWIAFSRYGLLIDPIFPMIFSFILYGLLTAMLFAFADNERKFVRNAFRHYLAPELLNKLEQSPEALKLGGEIKELSLMFMDIRNFTPISETMSPQELVTFLNNLLSPLSDAIHKHDGTIDKYIGDSIMAFWNAPVDVEDHPRKSCMAALTMMEKLEELNAVDAFDFSKRGLEPVGMGIGINTGGGCVGNMGSSWRFDYSVVGDTVNVAARLESASKDAGWPILVSQSTYAACSDLAFLEAGYLVLKGKSKKLPVYALVGDQDFAQSEEFEQIKLHHQNLVDGLTTKKRSKWKKSDLEKIPTKYHNFLLRLNKARFRP